MAPGNGKKPSKKQIDKSMEPAVIIPIKKREPRKAALIIPIKKSEQIDKSIEVSSALTTPPAYLTLDYFDQAMRDLLKGMVTKEELASSIETKDNDIKKILRDDVPKMVSKCFKVLREEESNSLNDAKTLISRMSSTRDSNAFSKKDFTDALSEICKDLNRYLKDRFPALHHARYENLTILLITLLFIG
jgi:hypothetical protein